jgi:hypothetical protein
LRDGDKNTHFFHKYASERRKRSRLDRLVLDDGRVVEREKEILVQVSDYYKNLFTSNAGNHMGLSSKLCQLGSRLK